MLAVILLLLLILAIAQGAAMVTDIDAFLSAIKDHLTSSSYQAYDMRSTASGAYLLADKEWLYWGGRISTSDQGHHAAYASKEEQDKIAKIYTYHLALTFAKPDGSPNYHAMARAWIVGEPTAAVYQKAGKLEADAIMKKMKTLTGNK